MPLEPSQLSKEALSKKTFADFYNYMRDLTEPYKEEFAELLSLWDRVKPMPEFKHHEKL